VDEMSIAPPAQCPSPPRPFVPASERARAEAWAVETGCWAGIKDAQVDSALDAFEGLFFNNVTLVLGEGTVGIPSAYASATLNTSKASAAGLTGSYKPFTNQVEHSPVSTGASSSGVQARPLRHCRSQEGTSCQRKPKSEAHQRSSMRR
jgi:hypothetical protein